MREYGLSRRAVFWYAAVSVVCSGMFLPELCPAQPPTRIVPPAPLGAPLVPVGPSANPFGPPPMAIGPAPGPVVFGPPPGPIFYGPPLPTGYGPPGYPLSGYPPVNYPAVPYMARRASASSSMPPALGMAAPQPAESQPVIDRNTTLAPMPMPATIGNLRLTVSENFLNRVVAKDEQRPGDVQDFILGRQGDGTPDYVDTKVRLGSFAER